MKIIYLKEQPEYQETAIAYIQSKWPMVWPQMYQDCISHSLHTEPPLPRWYLLQQNNQIIGCAGLITNDFISRMDLYPWICALFIEDSYRGNGYSHLLLEAAIQDAFNAGFKHVYLATDLIGFYEQYHFDYMGIGYHPWEETSRIYVFDILKNVGLLKKNS
ncbi:GNAT family N-acetyltransferase [Neisseria sp. Ec49-e6-T10]|uniref:GNAT family N-acetyltransferase n=1 Tax=Neisseria sp. Ec49-e6-T10 TaxID=3140744 RepID=UPI003EB887BE